MRGQVRRGFQLIPEEDKTEQNLQVILIREQEEVVEGK
jgi:hypothetical protein